MKTENVQLTFDDDAIKEIARISAEVRGPWVAMPRFDAAAGMAAWGWALASATFFGPTVSRGTWACPAIPNARRQWGAPGSVVGLRCRYRVVPRRC